jgi:hypothetical protein
MNQRGRLSENDIKKAVVDSVTAVAPDAGPIGTDTYLVGSEAILDSVGFVTLLVDLEGRLGNSVDLSTSFIEQDGLDDATNPFRTVDSLAMHIQRLCSKPDA